MLPIATKIDSLQGITIRLLSCLDDGELSAIKKKMLEIAADGMISSDEEKELASILERLDKLSKSISELRMLAEKCKERGKGNGTD